MGLTTVLCIQIIKKSQHQKENQKKRVEGVKVVDVEKKEQRKNQEEKREINYS